MTFVDLAVLIGYLCTDFEGGEKPKGGPLEIEFFFVEGGLRKGLEGGQEPSKTLFHLFNQQKIKILNLPRDNRQVPFCFCLNFESQFDVNFKVFLRKKIKNNLRIRSFCESRFLLVIIRISSYIHITSRKNFFIYNSYGIKFKY